jgi:hypothetical protein
MSNFKAEHTSPMMRAPILTVPKAGGRGEFGFPAADADPGSEDRIVAPSQIGRDRRTPNGARVLPNEANAPPKNRKWLVIQQVMVAIWELFR